MLRYVFIESKNGIIKVPCSEAEGNLPDFSAFDLTADGYERRLRQHEDYLAFGENKKKRRKEYDELFYGNIDLFMAHYEQIIGDPRFANIGLPHPLFGSMYVTFGGRDITLGEMLQLFKNEPNYSGVCPNCGAVVYLISFGFSPLSGRVFPTHRCYGDCKKTFCGEHNGVRIGCAGNQLRNIRMKYSKSISDIEPVHISTLLKALGKDVSFIEGYYEDDAIGGMRIGKDKGIVSLVQCDEAGGFNRIATHNQEQPQDADIIVPQECWTVEFTVAVLKTGLPFGNIPARYNTTEFLEMICAEFDYVPNLGELSPKHLSVLVCVAAIKDKSYFHRKRLLKLVPEHLRDEVLKQL